MKFSDLIHGPTHQSDSGYADADHAFAPPPPVPTGAPPITQSGGILGAPHSPVVRPLDLSGPASSESLNAAVQEKLRHDRDEGARLLADARRKAQNG
jgi:hypothetical protein